MNKEEILSRSRNEKKDEGVEYAKAEPAVLANWACSPSILSLSYITCSRDCRMKSPSSSSGHILAFHGLKIPRNP